MNKGGLLIVLILLGLLIGIGVGGALRKTPKECPDPPDACSDCDECPDPNICDDCEKCPDNPCDEDDCDKCPDPSTRCNDCKECPNCDECETCPTECDPPCDSCPLQDCNECNLCNCQTECDGCPDVVSAFEQKIKTKCNDSTERRLAVPLLECAQECYSDPKCTSFGFRRGNQDICYLWNRCVNANLGSNDNYDIYMKRNFFHANIIENYSKRENTSSKPIDQYQQKSKMLHDVFTVDDCAQLCEVDPLCIAFKHGNEDGSHPNTCYITKNSEAPGTDNAYDMYFKKMKDGCSTVRPLGNWKNYAHDAGLDGHAVVVCDGIWYVDQESTGVIYGDDKDAVCSGTIDICAPEVVPEHEEAVSGTVGTPAVQMAAVAKQFNS